MLNGETNEQAKRQMVKQIMQCQNCYYTIGDALFELGKTNTIMKTMRQVYEHNNGYMIVGGGGPDFGKMERLLQKRNPNANRNTYINQKHNFIELFKEFWFSISQVQAKQFMYKQSVEVLQMIYRNPLYSNTPRRLLNVNKIMQSIKNRKIKNTITNVALLKGGGKGKELLNVFNNQGIIRKGGKGKVENYHKLLMKTKEQEKGNFKYRPLEISRMRRNLNNT